MIVRLYCDNCKKEVAERDNFIKFFIEAGEENRYTFEVKDVKNIRDICLDCAREIVSFITQRNKWQRVSHSS